MKIKSFYVTKTFLLIMEFDNDEYRLLDMRRFLQYEKGLMKELISDAELFLKAELEEIAGTIRWRNDVDFNPEILYENSISLDNLTQNDSDEAYAYDIGFKEGFEEGVTKAIKLVSANTPVEERLGLAEASLNYLTLPKIIHLGLLSLGDAKQLIKQIVFKEYVKDQFDEYVENGGFFDKDAWNRIYQHRLKYANDLIEDIPINQIIGFSKILSEDLKKLLLAYVESLEEKVHSGHYPQEENKACDDCGVEIGDYTIYKGKTRCVGCWVEFEVEKYMEDKRSEI